MLGTYCSIKFNQWNGAFYNALESKNKDDIFYQIYYFIGLISIMSFVGVNRIYFISWLKVHWRRWMTNHYSQNWLKNNNFYHIQQTKNIDNIDQRISEDIALFVYTTIELIFSFFSAILSIGSFSIILWHLSGTLDFKFWDHEISIAGYMFYGAVLYAIGGFLIAKIIGRNFKSLNWAKQKHEADYRSHLMQIIEHNEALAFANVKTVEQSRLKKLFSQIYLNKKDLMALTRRYNIYTSFYDQGILLPPLFLALPRYLSGAINLGEFMQIRMAFVQVIASLSWFTESYDKIMSWFATIDRIAELNKLINEQQKNNGIKRQLSAENISIKKLELTKTDLEPLLQLNNWSLSAGERSYIQDKSGSGKTTLIKAIAGLWHQGEGDINVPDNIMYIPQRSFIPKLTLKKAICYPYSIENISDSTIIKALKDVQLEHLTKKIDTKNNWFQILSGGEKQRIALVKCFIYKPSWLILDEPLSGVDKNSAKVIIEKLIKKIPNAGILCISHEQWVTSHFNKQLFFNKAAHE